MSSAWKPSKLS